MSMTSFSIAGNEKLIDDPVLVDGKFVRNVGGGRTPTIYHYVYMKDGDKDYLRRLSLAVRLGASLGLTAGFLHVGSFGRNPKWPTRLDPFIRIAFCGFNGVVALALHSSTVALSSQVFGGKDLVFNWAAGGFVSGAYIYSVVKKTPARMEYLARLPLGFAAIAALIKVATVYDKPLQGVPRSTYGTQPLERTLGPRHYDTLNPYRKQEEHYLEKYL